MEESGAIPYPNWMSRILISSRVHVLCRKSQIANRNYHSGVFESLAKSLVMMVCAVLSLNVQLCHLKPLDAGIHPLRHTHHSLQYPGISAILKLLTYAEWHGARSTALRSRPNSLHGT